MATRTKPTPVTAPAITPREVSLPVPASDINAAFAPSPAPVVAPAPLVQRGPSQAQLRALALLATHGPQAKRTVYALTGAASAQLGAGSDSTSGAYGVRGGGLLAKGHIAVVALRPLTYAITPAGRELLAPYLAAAMASLAQYASAGGLALPAPVAPPAPPVVAPPVSAPPASDTPAPAPAAPAQLATPAKGKGRPKASK